MTATAEERTTQLGRVSAAITVRGLADIGDGRGYLRVAGYGRSGGDIPLTAAMVRRYGLRRGDLVEGTVTVPHGEERGRDRDRGRDRGLASVETINGLPAARANGRPRFEDLTPSTPASGSGSKTATRQRPPGSSTWSPPSARASAASSSHHRRRARPPC